MKKEKKPTQERSGEVLAPIYHYYLALCVTPTAYM